MHLAVAHLEALCARAEGERLKNLSARLSVKLGRPVSAHELVVAEIKTLLLLSQLVVWDWEEGLERLPRLRVDRLAIVNGL